MSVFCILFLNILFYTYVLYHLQILYPEFCIWYPDILPLCSVSLTDPSYCILYLVSWYSASMFCIIYRSFILYSVSGIQIFCLMVLYPLFCILYSVFCIWYPDILPLCSVFFTDPLFCILFLVSWYSVSMFCFLFLVSCVLYHAFSTPSQFHISCIMYPVACILHSVFCILYHVFCILYPVSCISLLWNKSTFNQII